MEIKKLVIILIASGLGLLLCAGTLAVSTIGKNPKSTDIIEFTTDPGFTETPAEEPTSTYYPEDEPEVPTPSPTASGATPAPTKMWPELQKSSIVPDAYIALGYQTPAQQPPAGYNMNYYVEVDITNQCVNIFIKNPSTGAYDVLLNRFICSSGAVDTPTPLGTFTIKGSESYTYLRYAWFPKWWTWAQYATRINGPYLFHSFTYRDKNPQTSGKSGGINLNDPNMKAYNGLGNKGSAGCIRLLVPNAKWIFENCGIGTVVNINTKHSLDKELKYVLKPPPYGTELTKDYPVKTMPPPTPVPTAKPTPLPTAVPTVSPMPTASPIPTPVPVPSPSPSPTVIDTTLPG